MHNFPVKNNLDSRNRLSGKMKLFLTVAALVNADQDVSIPESCIIAPADGQNLQSTSWGPIWKKLTSCDNDPQVGFQVSLALKVNF